MPYTCNYCVCTQFGGCVVSTVAAGTALCREERHGGRVRFKHDGKKTFFFFLSFWIKDHTFITNACGLCTSQSFYSSLSSPTWQEGGTTKVANVDDVGGKAPSDITMGWSIARAPWFGNLFLRTSAGKRGKWKTGLIFGGTTVSAGWEGEN